MRWKRLLISVVPLRFSPLTQLLNADVMWHRPTMKTWLAALVALLCLGCMMARYEDISSRPEYAGVIGASYRLRLSMVIHGVTLDANYKKVVDVYSVTPQSGMTGPEIVSRDELPVGTVIRVAKVLGCTNCIFGHGDRVEVQLPGLTKFSRHPVEMRFSFGDKKILLKESGRALLNPVLFEKP